MSLSISLTDLVNDKKYSKIAAILLSDEYNTESSDRATSLLTYQALVLSRQYTKFLSTFPSDEDNINLSGEESFLLAYVYYATGKYDKALQAIPKFNELTELSAQWSNLYAQTCYAMNNRPKALEAFQALKGTLFKNSAFKYETNYLAAFCLYGGCYYADDLPISAEYEHFDYIKNLTTAYDLAGCKEYFTAFAEKALEMTDNNNEKILLTYLMEPDNALGEANSKLKETLKQQQIHNLVIRSNKVYDIIEKMNIEAFKDNNERGIARLNLAIAHFHMKNMEKAKSLVEPLLDGNDIKAHFLAFELKLLTKEDIIKKFGNENIELQLYFSSNDLSVLENISDKKLKKSLAFMATTGMKVDPEEIDHPALLEKLGDHYLSCQEYDNASTIYCRIEEPHSGITAKLIICLSYTDPNEAELMIDSASFAVDDEVENEATSIDELLNSALRRRPHVLSNGPVKSAHVIRHEEQKEKNLKLRAKHRQALLAKYADAGIATPKPQTWISTKKHKKKRVQRYNQRFTRGSQGLTENGAATKSKIRSTAHLEVGGIGSLKTRNKSKSGK